MMAHLQHCLSPHRKHAELAIASMKAGLKELSGDSQSMVFGNFVALAIAAVSFGIGLVKAV